MQHESEIKKLQITESDDSFEIVYSKPYFPINDSEKLKGANFLLIPYEKFREGEEYLFPEVTTEFFEFVQDHTENIIVPDVAITDENFRKIELHSEVINLPIILTSVAFPIVLNLISNFLYDLLKKYRKQPDKVKVNVTIIEDKKNKQKTLKMEYEGPVSEIQDSLMKAFESYEKDNI